MMAISDGNILGTWPVHILQNKNWFLTTSVKMESEVTTQL